MCGLLRQLVALDYSYPLPPLIAGIPGINNDTTAFLPYRGLNSLAFLFLTRLIPYQGVYCGSAEDGAFISEMTGTRSPKTVRSSGISFCHQKAIPRPQGILCDPGFFPLREQSQHHGIDSALSCCICFFLLIWYCQGELNSRFESEILISCR